MNKRRNVESFKLLLRESFSISILTNTSNHNLIKCIIPVINSLEVLWDYHQILEKTNLVKEVLIMQQLKKQEQEIQVLLVEIPMLVTSYHWEIYFREIMMIEYKIT